MRGRDHQHRQQSRRPVLERDLPRREPQITLRRIAGLPDQPVRRIDPCAAPAAAASRSPGTRRSTPTSRPAPRSPSPASPDRRSSSARTRASNGVNDVGCRRPLIPRRRLRRAPPSRPWSARSPTARAIRAFGTPSAASLLINAQSSKVITLQSSSVHFSSVVTVQFSSVVDNSRAAAEIFTIAQLQDRGIGARKRAALLRDGELTRLRNGWFASRDADPDQSRAVRIGGQLTSYSALRQFGLWVMPDNRLHVSVAGNASRLRSPDSRATPFVARQDVCLHWAEHRMDTPTDSAIDGVKDSLAQLIRCADRASAVATLDSALNGTSAGRPLVTMDDVAEILLQLPAAYAELRGLVDANAQSGLDPPPRFRLRDRPAARSRALSPGFHRVEGELSRGHV